MKISLILATVGRTHEVERFIKFLNNQTYRNFELIVVDQNPDNCLAPILAKYKNEFPICHLRSEIGLSRARNAGLKHVTGEIVTFPDDDCWYPANLLEQVYDILKEHSDWDGVNGHAVDEKGNSIVKQGNKAGQLTYLNVWDKAISISFFLRKHVFEAVGLFDEKLGIGADTQWCSGEETDLMIRVVKNQFKVVHFPSIIIYHPNPVSCYDEKSYLRAIKYAYGTGYVLRKHNYPVWFVFYQWLRPFGGIFLALATGKITKAKYHWFILKGRVLGWMKK